jgi:hypothetical protein
MNRRSTVMLLSCIAMLATITPAQAEGPSKLECISANEKAQRFKREGKFDEARAELKVSMAASCPAPVREDSSQLLAEIEKQQPRSPTPPITSDRPKTEQERKQAEAEARSALEKKMRADSDQLGCELARKTDSAAGWQIYRDSFPTGACVEEASRRIAELAAKPNPPQPVPHATPAPVASADSAVPPRGRWTPSRIAGIAVASVGVVAFGIGAGFGVVAIGKKKDADSHCRDGNLCDAAGVALRDEGFTASYVSTGMFIGGAALAAGGIVLIVISPSVSAAKNGPSSASLAVAPAPGGVTLQGTW